MVDKLVCCIVYRFLLIFGGKFLLNPIFGKVVVYPTFWISLHYLEVNWVMCNQWPIYGVYLSMYIILASYLVKGDDTILPVRALAWSS